MYMTYDNKGFIQSNKQDLIREYTPLVKKIAGSLNKKLNYLVDIEDLMQSGMLGLMEAIDKFTHNKNAKFETYASTRIYGSIMDELRKSDPLSQEDRHMLKVIDNTTKKLETTGKIKDSEIAHECGLTLNKYHELLQLRNSSILLYQEDSEEMLSIVNNIPSDTLTPEGLTQQEQFKELLIKAIDELPEKEKLIVALYYQEELTFKEIGLILELTEARISQLHNQAINRLKLKLN